MDLKQYINSKNIVLYIKQIPERANVGRSLFPSKKQLGTTLEYAKGSKNRAVALTVTTFDSAAKVRSLKADVNINKKELPFFKEAIGMNETTRRDLINALGSNNENIVEFITGEVFDNYNNLVEGAEVQVDRMIAQAIQTSKINITTTDGDVVVDYGAPENQVVTLSTNKWNVAGTDILADIEKWKKLMRKNNAPKPTTMLMTETTFQNTIMANTAITAALKGEKSFLILTKQDYKDFMKKFAELDIVFLEDDVYIPSEGAEAQSYYEDGRVTFISGNTLGNFVYGTTPEEYDKIYGSTKLDVDVVRTAIAITTMVKEDPVGVDTKVSMLGLPSFERVDECLFAKVY